MTLQSFGWAKHSISGSGSQFTLAITKCVVVELLFQAPHEQVSQTGSNGNIVDLLLDPLPDPARPSGGQPIQRESRCATECGERPSVGQQ